MDIYARRIAEMHLGRVAPTLESLYTSTAFKRFRLIEQTMADHDVPDEAFEPMLSAFLESSRPM